VSGERGKRVAAYYGARYGDRAGGELNRSARIRADLFASWIGTGTRLLELGCGSGSLLEAYAAGNRVTAMDIDTPALEACRQRLGVEMPIRGRWSGRWPSLFAHRFAWRCRR
jgi:2-polyprenyl-3-methyl-5-hydroxy-6-metoxy-1,4-benzoquinol methylase